MISNAIKYSPDGGEIRISGRLEPSSEEYPCGSLLMSVKDEGLGVSKDDLINLEKSSPVSPDPRAIKAGGTGIRSVSDEEFSLRRTTA